MSWILAAVLISGAPDAPPSRLAVPAAEIVSSIELPTGSLIFSQGDCLAVRVFTASRYTHVGAVVESDGRRHVYDSTGGVGVRKLPLDEYLARQAEATVAIYRPVNAFTPHQTARFTAHLDQELGRPYAITHHLTGGRSDGLHCAEYVTDALIAADVLKARQPARVSPASLLEGIETADLYDRSMTFEVDLAPASPPSHSGWCGRMWFETRTCTVDCYRKLRGWFCCK